MVPTPSARVRTKNSRGEAKPRLSASIFAWSSAVTFSGCTSAIGCTPICSLMMNSMRARPTPAFGIIAVRNARSGLPRFTMISVFGSASVLIGTRVTSNGTAPARTVPFSPSAQDTVTTVPVVSVTVARLGADDGGHAQFARDDGGVAGAAAAVGDDGAGGLHHRFPVGAGGAGDQHLAGPERAQIGGAGDDADDAGADLLADRLAAHQHVAAALQRVSFVEPGFAPRGHGLRPRLHDVQLAVVGVLRPFDVHRHGMAGELRIMLLDADRGVGQRQHLRVGQAEARAFGGLGRHVQRAGGDYVRRRRSAASASARACVAAPRDDLAERSAYARRTRPDRRCPARRSRPDRRRR